MKICLASDQLVGYHKNWSGAEMVCQHLANILKKENQEIIFITTKFDNKVESSGIFQLPRFNIKPLFLKKFLAPFSRISGFIYSFYYLLKENPDIVHFFHSNYLSIPVMLSAWVLRIPIVFSVLDYFIICPRNNLRLDNGEICDKLEGWHCRQCISLPNLLERFIIRRLFKKIKGIITFTGTSKSRLIKYGIPADKIRVIYTYGLSLTSAIKDKKETEINSNTILFVGAFSKYKGIDILIQAFSKIVKEIPNSRLMIVGMGYEWERVRIKKIIGDLGLQDYISFLGKKKNEEVLRLILESEVVVVPEQWPSDFGPLILVEAMAAGRPVVASQIGAIPEFIKDGHNGFLVEYDNPEQFAKKIVWLLKNKESARLMGQRAKSSIWFLSHQDQAEKILNLYHEIKDGKI